MSETKGLNTISYQDIDYGMYKKIFPKSKIVANVEQLKSDIAKQSQIIEMMARDLFFIIQKHPETKTEVTIETEADIINFHMEQWRERDNYTRDIFAQLSKQKKIVELMATELQTRNFGDFPCDRYICKKKGSCGRIVKDINQCWIDYFTQKAGE
jgi:hypothetical protein